MGLDALLGKEVDSKLYWEIKGFNKVGDIIMRYL